MVRNAALEGLRTRIGACAWDRAVTLVAASKSQPASAIRELAAAGQRVFGENYVQEALGKQRELAELDLEWHMIGPLQSNKCAEVARHFDWLQSLDREKLVPLLDRARRPELPPLNVLIEVNVSGESSKSGCAPGQLSTLADKIMRARRLRLRGLMAIPAPEPDPSQRRAAFARLRGMFDGLRRDHPLADTLSMGMSDDFELAIAEGATMVRVGTALFGPRKRE
ncbi:MAG TPA: YggS family pyridoxal phosphate-dependent enzyme [Rhodanobacteraceae bacterium]|nr:YggS family pyridoxal phosphate-dependent enzyme [Rhodanobacteraceae bacterium]